MFKEEAYFIYYKKKRRRKKRQTDKIKTAFLFLNDIKSFGNKTFYFCYVHFVLYKYSKKKIIQNHSSKTKTIIINFDWKFIKLP